MSRTLKRLSASLNAIAAAVKMAWDIEPSAHPEDNPWLDAYEDLLDAIGKQHPGFEWEGESDFWDMAYFVPDGGMFYLNPSDPVPTVEVTTPSGQKRHHPLTKSHLHSILRDLT